MRLLVTGGAGYIGSIVAQQLVARGDDVTVLDSLYRATAAPCPRARRSSRPTCSTPKRSHEVFAGGLRRRRCTSRRCRSWRESVEFPERYWRGNVVGALNLLDAMRAAGVQRIVFSSTAATYGEPDVELITEDDAERAGQHVRQLEARGRPDARRRGARARARGGLAALLQRRGRERAAGRGPHARDAPDPAGAAGRGRQARERRRSSAPTTRRRTAPRCATTSTSTTSRRAHAAGAGQGGRRAARHLQPRVRDRLLGARGDRGRAAR